jgi:hypothetical protein
MASLGFGRVGGVGRLSREIILDGEVTPGAIFNAGVQTTMARAIPCDPKKMDIGVTTSAGPKPHFLWRIGKEHRHAFPTPRSQTLTPPGARKTLLEITDGGAATMWKYNLNVHVSVSVLTPNAALSMGSLERSCFVATAKAYIRGNLHPVRIAWASAAGMNFQFIQTDENSSFVPYDPASHGELFDLHVAD